MLFSDNWKFRFFVRFFAAMESDRLVPFLLVCAVVLGGITGQMFFIVLALILSTGLFLFNMNVPFKAGNRITILNIILILLIFIPAIVRYDTNGVVIYNSGKKTVTNKGFLALINPFSERVLEGTSNIINLKESVDFSLKEFCDPKCPDGNATKANYETMLVFNDIADTVNVLATSEKWINQAGLSPVRFNTDATYVNKILRDILNSYSPKELEDTETRKNIAKELEMRLAKPWHNVKVQNFKLTGITKSYKVI